MNGQLDFFYYRSHLAGTYVDFHKHNCFELVYYLSGCGAMLLNGNTLRYGPNTVSITRPNYMHDEQHDEATDVIFFGFTYDDDPLPLANGIFCDEDDKEILGLVLCMKEEILARKFHYSARVNLLVNEIILLLGRKMPEATVEQRPEMLFYARRFIDENYTQPIQLQTLAEISGYSNDYFRHLFKKVTGLSPVQYILQKRLEKAKFLLLHTSSSVSVIGMDCGFSTTSQFIEMFKRAYKITPLQYRISGMDA